MDTQGMSGTTRGHRPPYVSYPSFKTLIGEFHDHDIPTRIDRSVLTRFSGIVGTQLLTALRFLSLIDESSAPTDRLRELVAAYGTSSWAQSLLAILHEEYGPMFQLDLAAATSSHFTETFRKAYPGSDAVSQKCVAFFLGAAKDAGIAVSERVLKGRKPRSPNGSSPRRPRAARAAASTQPPPPPPPTSTPSETSKPLEYQLIDLLKDNDISEEERKAIWTLVQFLSNKKTEQNTAR
jgi:hypothetical protein